MANNDFDFSEILTKWAPKLKGGLIEFMKMYKSLADMAIDKLNDLPDEVTEPKKEPRKPTNLKAVKKEKEE